MIICYYSDFDLKSLKSLTSCMNQNHTYFKMENIRSVDEYLITYKFKPFAVIMKVIEVIKYVSLLFRAKQIIFSTPHPSFRIIKYFRPVLSLHLYLRNTHLISESQSLSDRLAKFKSISLFKILFDNYYADYYYVPGLVNQNFLVNKGVNLSNIKVVGLHPTGRQINLLKLPNRIIVISQAWAAHGFINEYITEVKSIKFLIAKLKEKFNNKFDIILKIHPRENIQTYSDLDCSVLLTYQQENNSDIIVGGLSSFYFENINDNFYPIFYVNKDTLKYYAPILRQFNLPFCADPECVINKICNILNGTDNLESETQFILSNVHPLIFL